MNFLGHEVVPHFGMYGNENTAIQLLDAEDGLPFAVATVNGNRKLPEDTVGIKTWSENKGIDKVLVNGNIIEPEVIDTEPAGFAQIEYHKLTEQGLHLLRQAKGEE